MEFANVDFLTVEEELTLFADAKQGDTNATDRLILSHLPLVHKMASKLKGYDVPLEDMIQEGIVGLTKAVHRFDPSNGFRLSTYATHWINAEMLMFASKNHSIVNVVTTKEARKAFFNLRKYRPVDGKMTADDIQRASTELGLSVKDIVTMNAKLQTDVSVDVADDEEGVKRFTFEAPNANPSELFEQYDTALHADNAFTTALRSLNEREADIIAKRWLNDIGKVTMAELANVYQVSPARVQQIETAAIKKMKKAVAEYC